MATEIELAAAATRRPTASVSMTAAARWTTATAPAALPVPSSIGAATDASPGITSPVETAQPRRRARGRRRRARSRIDGPPASNASPGAPSSTGWRIPGRYARWISLVWGSMLSIGHGLVAIANDEERRHPQLVGEAGQHRDGGRQQRCRARRERARRDGPRRGTAPTCRVARGGALRACGRCDRRSIDGHRAPRPARRSSAARWPRRSIRARRDRDRASGWSTSTNPSSRSFTE